MTAYGDGAYGAGTFGEPSSAAAPGITVTADASNQPPRFEITLSTPDGLAMTGVQVNRSSGGSTVPLRVQPTTGFITRYVSDYEGAWGAPVVYSATITTANGTTTYAAPAVTLFSAAAWLIHPLDPRRSFRIDTRDTRQAGFRSLGAVTRPSTSNRLRPIGAKLPVQIRIGARQASQSQLMVSTVTAAEEDALWDVLDDQVPLLLRVPPAWGWHVEDGYYDVDGPAAERQWQYGPDPARTWTLPVFRVAPPAGDQASTWSYPELTAAFPDYPTLKAAYADYPSLTADNRR